MYLNFFAEGINEGRKEGRKERRKAKKFVEHLKSKL